MRELLINLLDAARSGKPVAYTALVETRGSTPQKAGAVMLVYADGSQAGTLGGGCVEAEVKRRALALLKDGQRELMTFQLDSNYGWDDGLICGGRMAMLVDPIRTGGDVTYFETLLRCLDNDQPCTEAVLLEPSTAGARFLLDATGTEIARRANEKAPAIIASNLRDVRTRPRPYILSLIHI